MKLSRIYDNDVFISYKHTDESGGLTRDYYIAEKLYMLLASRGIHAFFSDKTLFSLGTGDYKKAIDSALSDAKVLIVIGTSLENLLSPWVEYEYETFYEDFLSGKKKNACIVSYTSISAIQLPRTLSRFQNYQISQVSADTIVEFVGNALSKNSDALQTEDRNPRDVRLQSDRGNNRIDSVESLPGAFHKSVYTSDYRNELDRLVIQSQNSLSSDRKALDYIFSQAQWPDDEKICILDLGSAYGHVAQSRFASIDGVEKILCIDFNKKVLERAKIIFAENPKMIFECADIESNDFVMQIADLKEKHAIPKFHIIYSALTLHHLRNPKRVLRNLRKIMSEDSFIMIRGSDDGSKLCYPQSDLMEEIIHKTMQATGVSDRINGRKIFSQLFDSGYRNIRIFSDMRDLSQLEYDSRALLFQESFSYRINYFKKALDADPDNRQAIADYQWMENALEMFEDQFFQKNFWYCEYDYIGVAQ